MDEPITPRTVAIQIRVPTHLIDQMQRIADDVRATHPGLRVSVAGVARTILVKALEKLAQAEAAKKAGTT